MTPRHLSATRLFADSWTASLIAILMMLFILYVVI